MPRIGFDSLAPYSWPGGQITGAVLLETDKPAHGRDLTVRLRAYELSQTTVSTGKSTQRIVQEVPLLDTAYDLTSAIAFSEPGHLAPGSYRVPFTFNLPNEAEPSIRSAVDWQGPHGLLSARPDGLYVEYALEARLDVPWWPDAKATATVPVYSARRVLGILPPMQSQPNPNHPTVSLRPAGPGQWLPGTPYPVEYEVGNPRGKELKALRVSLRRRTEYRVRGLSRSCEAPSFAFDATLGGRAGGYTGEIALTIPNEQDATGPWSGQLYRTYWVARAELHVELGFDVVVEAPLLPG